LLPAYRNKARNERHGRPNAEVNTTGGGGVVAAIISPRLSRRVENPNLVSGDGLGSMLCAPIPHSLRSDSLIRTHDAINGMTLEQLRTGIF
jgi:hypothetical protein